MHLQDAIDVPPSARGESGQALYMKPSDRHLFTVYSAGWSSDRIVPLGSPGMSVKLLAADEQGSNQRIVQALDNSSGRYDLRREADRGYTVLDRMRNRIGRVDTLAPARQIDNVDLIHGDLDGYHYASTYGDGETALITSIRWEDGGTTRFGFADVFPGSWFYPDASSVTMSEDSTQFLAFAAGIVDDDKYCLAATVLGRDGAIVASARRLLDERSGDDLGFVEHGQVAIVAGAPVLVVAHRSVDGTGNRINTYRIGDGGLTLSASHQAEDGGEPPVYGAVAVGGWLAIGQASSRVNVFELP